LVPRDPNAAGIRGGTVISAEHDAFTVTRSLSGMFPEVAQQ
jgi:hypothetical protein